MKGIFPRVTNPSAAPHRSEALDLHVLGLPPAFVLSQDQTLKFDSEIITLLNVQTISYDMMRINEFPLFRICFGEPKHIREWKKRKRNG